MTAISAAEYRDRATISMLDHPEGEGPLETWQPRKRIITLADRQGGYLAHVG